MHVLALQRFLARGSGFMGKAMDSSLESLGLESLCPSHHHRLPDCKIFFEYNPWILPHMRLSCDFAYRYWRKAATVVQEERFEFLTHLIART